MQAFRTRIRRTALIFMIVLLALFSLVLYFGLSTILYRHIDEDLKTLALQESQRVELATDHIEMSTPPHREDGEESQILEHEEEEIQNAIRFSVILDKKGRILWSGDSVRDRQPVPPYIIDHTLRGETTFETIKKPGSIPIRRISIPIMIEERGPFILQTEKTLQFVEDTLWWLTWLLTGASTGLILFAWWGSGRLANEALAPVDTLSRTAAAISEQTLSTRLSLTAPYTDFQRLTSAFNGMLDRLQQVFEGQRRFVADAAHELKTPLTAMKGNLEVILQRPRTPEEYREAILANLNEVDRLTAMTKSLLTLAQFAGNRPPVNLQPFDLTSLLRGVVDEFSVLAQDQDIRLQEDYESVPPFTGDPSQLKQALINLLDNALRHTPHGGTITVRLLCKESSTIIMVSDTGPGIDSRHLPHLFERFYRVDQARDRQSGGTGLGLAIVKEIVEAHRGSIHVESQPGAGATFTLTFPAEGSRS